jgi:hypothetical protein
MLRERFWLGALGVVLSIWCGAAQAQRKIEVVPPNVGEGPLGPRRGFEGPRGPEIETLIPDNDITIQPITPTPDTAISPGYQNGGVSGSGPAGGGSPPIGQRSFRIAYCVYTANPTSDCSEGTDIDAANKLGRLYWDVARNKIITNTMAVRFPDYLSKYEQLEYLRKLEIRSITLVSAWLRHDVSTLTPFNWRVEDNRQVNNWAARAQSGASSGSNWTHDWSISNHTFSLGPSYDQAVSINLHGW